MHPLCDRELSLNTAPEHAAAKAGIRMTRRRFGLLSLSLLGIRPGHGRAGSLAPSTNPFDPFVVYYGEHAAPAIADYRLAVLDGTVERRALDHPNTTCLGYISMGEVASYRDYYANVLEEGILGAVNPAWPDSRFVDMRDERWHRRVLDKLIPEHLERGFDGVFLDTLDNAEHLEATAPRKYRGVVDAAASLVDKMRRRFTNIPIMINRGCRLLPLVPGRFDMLLGESVCARFSDDGGYVMQSKQDYEWQRNAMWAAKERDPKLHLFALDYWDPADQETIAWIVETERSNGFVSYVSTKDLQQIFALP